MANIDRFAAIVADRGAGMNLAHCLMTDNWTTFPELLMLAEERALDVSINTVRFPEEHSLYHLTPSALSEVVEALDRRTPEVEQTITGSRLSGLARATRRSEIENGLTRSGPKPWVSRLMTAQSPTRRPRCRSC